MKNFATFLAMSAYLAGSAMAQDHIKCEFKIPDNKVGCLMSFLNCPEKELAQSKKDLHIAVNEGEQLNGKIRFNHVVLHPGTKKQDKNKVYLFEDDLRHEKLRDEKDVDLVAYEAEHTIDYTVKKEGPFVYLHLASPNMKLNFTMKGQIGFSDYIITPFSAVAVKCDKINKDVFEAGERKRKAIEEHLKNKKQKEEKSAGARSE